jgi:NAD(P)-dependent dehydrogenase (short-subunit alcohol dehydrogenase family)
MAAGRNAERLTDLARELGVETFAIADAGIDVIESVAGQAKDLFGRLDGMANCIGSILLKPAHLTAEKEWEEALRTNAMSAFAVVRAAVRTMPKGGSVVLVASAAARIGLANHEAIAAAKGAVIGLTRSAAATYAARRLRVNCVAPGLVRTGLTKSITDNERSSAYSTSLHALGRLGEPADVASVMAWLLDPESSWITGQVVGVDGGLASVRAR